MAGIEASDLHLRPFLRSDEDEVTTWFPDAGAVRFFAGTRMTWPLDSQQWQGIRDDPRISAWTAVLRDLPAPVGHGQIEEESASVIRVARIAIAPSQRGQGLGRTLIMRLIERGRVGGHSLAIVDVHPDNLTAIRGYRGLGFEPTSGSGQRGTLRMQLSLLP